MIVFNYNTMPEIVHIQWGLIFTDADAQKY